MTLVPYLSIDRRVDVVGDDTTCETIENTLFADCRYISESIYKERDAHISNSRQSHKKVRCLRSFGLHF